MSTSPARPVRGRLVGRLAPVAAALALAVLASCGGSSPGLTIRAEVDLSGLPPEADIEGTMEGVRTIIESRLEGYGPSAEIAREGEDVLVVRLDEAISEDAARRLVETTAKLELRQPVLDGDGNVTCRGEDGGEFSVPPSHIAYTSGMPDGPPTPFCEAEDGRSGEIVWEPAMAQAPGGAGTVPLATDLPISAIVDRSGAPVVVFAVPPSLGQALETFTTDIIGLPLGIFLDDEPLAGPTIQEPITTGNLAIAGLTLDDALVLVGQLAGGPLPVPVRVLSIEGPEV